MRPSTLCCLGVLLLASPAACGTGSPLATASQARTAPTPSQAIASEARTAIPAGQTAGFVIYGANQRKDIYGWDGRFILRTDFYGTIGISPDGRYYVDSDGRIWSWAGEQTGTIGEWNSSVVAYASSSWAADGDLYCASGEDSSGNSAIYITDPQGHSRHLVLGSIDVASSARTPRVQNVQFSIWECSQRTNRAVVLDFSGGSTNETISLVSLSDGQLLSVPRLTNPQVGVFSSDARWWAQPVVQSGGKWSTEVIDLTDGAVQTTISDAFPAAFSPDGSDLVVSDQATKVSMLNWRTGTELWSTKGSGVSAGAASDPATNKLLLSVARPGTMAGADYWIVDGSGAASQFTPQS